MSFLSKMAVTSTLATIFLVSGCASVEDRQDFKSRADVNHDLRRFQSEHRDMLSGKPVVEDIEGLYLGSGKVHEIDKRHVLPPGVDQEISLFDASPMSLEAIAERIEEVAGVRTSIRGGGSEGGMVGSNFGSGSVDDVLRGVLAAGEPTPPEYMRLQFRGQLSDLLERVASRFNVFWEYKAGEIRFSREATRTYEIASLAGNVDLEAAMSNSSGGGEGGEAYVSAEGGLETTYTMELDPWVPLSEAIESVLGEEGSYAINQATSTVIVTAGPAGQAAVKDLVDSVNDVMTRQVALNISVFTLRLDENKQAGFDLDAAYTSYADNFGLEINGAELGSNMGGDFSATLFEDADSRFAGSSLLLQALNEWGETSIVTSASGIVLNGQPFPVQDVNRLTYLASTEVSQMDEGGTSTSLTPGMVTTGFSMQLMPQILSEGNLLLQYAFTLSSLEDLVELSSGDQTIQGPEVDDRSFTQRTLMPMGGTLVLAGFQRDEDSVSRTTGATSLSRGSDKGKTMVFVTITATEA